MAINMTMAIILKILNTLYYSFSYFRPMHNIHLPSPIGTALQIINKHSISITQLCEHDVLIYRNSYIAIQIITFNFKYFLITSNTIITQIQCLP